MRPLEIDLGSPDDPIEATNGPVWITVRIADEVVGFAERDRLDPAGARALRSELIEWFADRLCARSVLNVAPRRRAITARDVTIVVCTRDRPEHLERCLRAARELDPAPGEIIVVDNASVTDDTKALAERYAVRYALELAPGLDNARNRGWREAATKVVAYVDDDARVEPGFAGAIADAFLAPEVGCVAGLVLAAELDTGPQMVMERSVQAFRAGGLDRRIFHREVAPAGFETWSVGSGANMAFRRDVLDALGGFDPLLDVGTRTRGGGDLDMFFRVLHAGHVVVYEPRAIVRHVHRRSERDLVSQVTDWGVALSAYLAKRRGESADMRRAVRRYRRRLNVEIFVRRPLRAALARRSLRLRMEVGFALGALRGRSAIRREATAQRSAADVSGPDRGAT